MSQMNRSSNNRGLSDEDLQQVTKDTTRFVMNKCGGSRVPLKRADILKYLSSSREGMTKHANEILCEVNKLLKEVYGNTLVEIGTKKNYILVKHKEEPPGHEEQDCKEHLMLVAALSHIFMNGGSVREEALWRFLERAGLMDEDDIATKKIFTGQFVKENYLAYSKMGEADNPRFVFEWGLRANEEMPKKYLLGKIGEAFDRPPEYWCEQNKEAMEKIQPNA